MPDCPQFKLYVGDEITSVIAVLHDELKRRGGSLSGDEQRGTFSIPLPIGGAVGGTYEISGASISIAISNRPDSISCGTIESKMQDFVLDAKATLKGQARGQRR